MPKINGKNNLLYMNERVRRVLGAGDVDTRVASHMVILHPEGIPLEILRDSLKNALADLNLQIQYLGAPPPSSAPASSPEEST